MHLLKWWVRINVLNQGGQINGRGAVGGYFTVDDFNCLQRNAKNQESQMALVI